MCLISTAFASIFTDWTGQHFLFSEPLSDKGKTQRKLREKHRADGQKCVQDRYRQNIHIESQMNENTYKANFMGVTAA